MSLIQIYEAGRLGWLKGLRNPYPVFGQNAEAGAWECGWMDARRAGYLDEEGKP